jgi:hypothetical protein
MSGSAIRWSKAADPYRANSGHTTIQVLLSEGVQRLTTTRVAERAGVSVGTMYISSSRISNRCSTPCSSSILRASLRTLSAHIAL